MLTLCLSLLLLITNNSNNSQITDKKEKVMKFELTSITLASPRAGTDYRNEKRLSSIMANIYRLM